MGSRFIVMAMLQAARAEFLGLPVDKALSFGLNRAIWYAAAKHGFAPSHRLAQNAGQYHHVVAEAKNLEVVPVGNERALVDKRTGYFTIGGKDQTPAAFQNQIASRVRDFNMAWSEAHKLVSSFPDEVLLSREAFYKKIYEPNRDILAAKWGDR